MYFSSNYNFNFFDNILNIIDIYKYLGSILNKSPDLTHTMDTKAEYLIRALSAFISKSLWQTNLPFQVCSTLHNRSMVPVMDYFLQQIYGTGDGLFSACTRLPRLSTTTEWRPKIIHGCPPLCFKSGIPEGHRVDSTICDLKVCWYCCSLVPLVMYGRKSPDKMYLLVGLVPPRENLELLC